MPAVRRFNAPYDWAAIADETLDQGAAIVTGLLCEEDVAEINGSLQRYLASVRGAGESASGSPAYDAFLGDRTFRLHGLLEKAPAVASVMAHPDILEWVRTLIAPRTRQVQMNAAEYIQIQPGEKIQQAHRDSDSWPLAIGDRPLIVNAIYALDDFSEANGATWIAPGSFRWPPSQRAEKAQYTRAVMKRGDAILFRGDLIHRGGANETDVPRRGLSISYCAGYLRPVENSFLNLSVATVKQLSPELQATLGYAAYDGSVEGSGLLGLFENGDPARVLEGQQG